ncbi:MAG: polysaccharide deacetylase family sporulation protein PdaB [Bacillota bacterium]|nr:polysaccharide deacetylase family sporulation protein PdaB [Bacillota bacterium]
MHVIFIQKNLLKRMAVVCVLLLVGIVAAVAVDYNDKGAFMNINKKMPIYSVDTKEKKVAISFDTSWGADNTLKILDVLDKYNVKATFFIIGRWAQDYPEETKEIAKRGNEIGNHSDKHPIMTKISKEQILNEISSCDAKLATLTGSKPMLFRCPEGEYNDLVVQTVEETNHTCIQWNVDSIDWKEQGADIEYNRIINKVKPGSILLFHNNAKYTPENLSKIIEKLKSEGYEFVKVSDLIYKDNFYLDNEGKQIRK